MVRDGSTREAQRFMQLTYGLWEELKDAKEGNGTVIAAHNLDFQRPTRLTICARWIVESGVSEPG
jgi:hypothetical protein